MVLLILGLKSLGIFLLFGLVFLLALFSLYMKIMFILSPICFFVASPTILLPFSSTSRQLQTVDL